MGKLTRARTKYHTSSSNKQQATTASLDVPAATAEGGLPSINLPGFSIPSDLFANVDVSQLSFQQQGDEFLANVSSTQNDDARSTLSKKSFKSEGQLYSKKDKRLLRREAFLMKLNAAKQADVEEKKRKKRQKTVIVGDMKPMLDSLPSLASLVPKVEKPRPTKQRSIQKIKTQSRMHNARVAKYKDAFLDFCNPTKKS